ncbi:MAG: HEAT repeat domain-containing protein, partial [Candidatus Thorarchaeota archaeon]|nr:HEAT repeat domain-containing protein [Candidatus Thorarchaeota archaeon]
LKVLCGCIVIRMSFTLVTVKTEIDSDLLAGGLIVPEEKPRSSIRPIGGTNALRKLKRVVKRIMGPSQDELALAASRLESIQACRDMSLTGDNDQKILAVCRLAEYGSEALESLELVLHDDSDKVRVTAVGMIGYMGDLRGIQALQSIADDSSGDVQWMTQYSIQRLWELPAKPEPEVRTSIREVKTAEVRFILDEPMPLYYTDDVIVEHNYSVSVDSLTFILSVHNQSNEPLQDVTVAILAFPSGSLKAPNERIVKIAEIPAADKITFEYNMPTFKESIEGEIVTAVRFTDSKGDRIAAKAGHCFVRSFFEHLEPKKTTSEEFLKAKKRMKNWNREHVLEVEPQKLLNLLENVMEDSNLYIFRSETAERQGMLMGLTAGIGRGKFGGSLIAITLTLVGRVDDNLSKLRIDIYSDDVEFLHTAASQLFETIQVRVLGNE